MLADGRSELPARALPALLVFAVAGCQVSPADWFGESEPESVPQTPEASTPVLIDPVATHRFVLEPDRDIVGEIRVVRLAGEDTFSDLARRFNLGYDELVLANPGVDPWLPDPGSEVILPTRFILPAAPREGVVINLASLRLFYFPEVPQDEAPVVFTHPIGIGRLGWATPTGSTTVKSKARDPVWYVPASIRREHAEAGDPLPGLVPPGPDNPLGSFVITLSMPGYLIHGTNKPNGVGMRVSHGCIRLYPEDIEVLYPDIPLDAPVHIVNQPFLTAWDDGEVYLEAHAMLEDDDRDWSLVLEQAIDATLRAAPIEQDKRTLDWRRAGAYARAPAGIPLPVTEGSEAMEGVVASATRVQNKIPKGANWDGVIEYRIPEEEIEALITDEPLGTGLAEVASAGR